jgi:TolB-like protein/Flp pilus assembly protein TadD
MALAIGTELASYEITGRLGKGGMGEVYRARDMKLKRDVAIKILPEEFSRDADRVSRFQREAEVLASLNHASIATIYDLQEANGSRFLVLELVEGETLADRIACGPIPVEEARDIAKQICDALEAAHDKGIVHRDLKPGNIMVRFDGCVKVLDFGLAKRIPGAGALTAATTALSAPDQIMGTAAYMSPEQILGQDVDARSDLFSLGIILYEIIGGVHPWARASPVDTMHAILHDDPPLLQSDWAGVIDNLLPKNRDQRYASADAVLEALAKLPGIPSKREPAETPSSARLLASIAVLPFLFLNEVEGHDALTIGFADALITMLGSLEELAVRPTSAILKYTAGTDPSQVCRDLAVRYALQGNIQKLATRWRVSVQLFDAAAGKVAFSSKHDFEMKDVFDAQDELGRRVVESLRGHLPLTLRRARDRYSSDPGAFNEFMSGLQESYSGQQEVLESAAGHLSRAVGIDPEFPIAHATLAIVSAHLYFEFDPRRAWLDKAEHHCREALRLDPVLAEGHMARAAILWSPAKNFQHAETISALEQALEAQPNLEGAHNRMASVCWHIGRTEEARLADERAQQLNPKARPVNLIWVHACNGDFARAVEVAEGWLKQAPDNRYFLNRSAHFSVLAGDLARAEQRLTEGLRLWPDEPLFVGTQGLLHARRGENALALECVRRALDSPRSFGHTHHVHNQIACIYAAVGETDKAMGWLERTADTGFPCWPFFLVDPFLESLRDKVEFKRLIDDLRRTYQAFKIRRL